MSPDFDVRKNTVTKLASSESIRPVSTPMKGLGPIAVLPEGVTPISKDVNPSPVEPNLFGDDGGLHLVSVSKCSHNFELNSTVKHCDICDKTVHFMRDPGFKCSKCKMNVHPTCRRKALGLPPKKQKRKTAKEFLLFRYVRLEDVLIKVSAKGFPYVMELNKFEVHLSSFKISKKLWTYEKLVDQIKYSLSNDVLYMAPSLVGKFVMDNVLSGRKKDKSRERNESVASVSTVETSGSKTSDHSRQVSVDFHDDYDAHPVSPSSAFKDVGAGMEVKMEKLGKMEVANAIKTSALKKLNSYWGGKAQDKETK